jgi:hypothetical protein
VGGGAQTMYTHISKCKNDKIKEEKKLSMKKGCKTSQLKCFVMIAY